MEYINHLREYVGNAPLILIGAAVLVLDKDNRLLMMERSDNGKWGIPGGAMELGESAEETACRELFEETNLRTGELVLFDVFSGKELYYQYPTGEEVYNVSIVYLAKKADGTIKLKDGEHKGYQFFHFSEIPEDVSPPIKPILRKLIGFEQND